MGRRSVPSASSWTYMERMRSTGSRTRAPAPAAPSWPGPAWKPWPSRCRHDRCHGRRVLVPPLRGGRTGAPPPWTSSSSCRPSKAACAWRAQSTESTALGAATVAGVAEGVWSSLHELSAQWHADAVFDVWLRAVETSMGRASPDTAG